MSSKNQNNRDANKQQSLEEVLAVGTDTGDYNIRFPSGQDGTDSATPYIKITGTTAPPTGAPSGVGQLAFDEAGEALYVHQSGGWAKILDSVGDVPTLQEVLTASNTTGGNDIVISSGDAVQFNGGDVEIPATLNVANVKMGYSVGSAITIGEENVLIGSQNSAILTTGSRNVMLGSGVNATGVGSNDCVAIGTNALTTGAGIAIGRNSECSRASSLAIGDGAEASGNGSFITVVGNLCKTGGIGTVAVGAGIDLSATITGTAYNNIFIGAFSGMGNNPVLTSADNDICIGTRAGKAITTGSFNSLLGFQCGDTIDTGASNVCVGNSADVSAGSVNYSVAVGRLAVGNTSCVAVGNTAVASGTLSISLGATSSALATRSTVVGFGAYSGASASYSVAIGDSAYVSASSGIAIGDNSISTGANAIALGSNVNNSVANTVLMAPSSSVRINSTLRVNNTVVRNTPSVLKITDSDQTLTPAQVLNNIFYVGDVLTTTRTITFPTYADLSSALPNYAEHDTFEFTFVNGSSTQLVNLASNTGCSFLPSGTSPQAIFQNTNVRIQIYMLSSTYQIYILSAYTT